MEAITSDLQDFQDSASLKWGSVYPHSLPELWRQPHRWIRVRGDLPPWWTEVAPRLYALLRLQDDWDPRGSRPISPEDLSDALQFLIRVMRRETVAPWIGPLASGGVELVWRLGNIEVEAIFDRARDERELLLSVGENESEVPIDQAEALFAEVVDRLAVDEGAPLGGPVAA